MGSEDGTVLSDQRGTVLERCLLTERLEFLLEQLVVKLVIDSHHDRYPVSFSAKYDGSEFQEYLDGGANRQPEAAEKQRDETPSRRTADQAKPGVSGV